jgi:predicted GNAT family acetyltransferase
LSDELSFAHEPQRNRFVARIGDAESVLEYRRLGNGTLELYRTFTPVALRGRGIGGRLVTYALEHALRGGYDVRATCPFVAKIIESDERFRSIVSRENS